jgi:hypothetical protein
LNARGSDKTRRKDKEVGRGKEWMAEEEEGRGKAKGKERLGRAEGLRSTSSTKRKCRRKSRRAGSKASKDAKLWIQTGNWQHRNNFVSVTHAEVGWDGGGVG